MRRVLYGMRLFVKYYTKESGSSVTTLHFGGEKVIDGNHLKVNGNHLTVNGHHLTVNSHHWRSTAITWRSTAITERQRPSLEGQRPSLEGQRPSLDGQWLSIDCWLDLGNWPLTVLPTMAPHTTRPNSINVSCHRQIIRYNFLKIFVGQRLEHSVDMETPDLSTYYPIFQICNSTKFYSR